MKNIPVEKLYDATKERPFLLVSQGVLCLFSRVDHKVSSMFTDSPAQVIQQGGKRILFRAIPITKEACFNLHYLTEYKSSDNHRRMVEHMAASLGVPRAELAGDGIFITVPKVSYYQKLLHAIGGSLQRDGRYRIPFSKLDDLIHLSEREKTSYPPIEINQELLDMRQSPLPQWDGTLPGLRDIPISTLNVVRKNVQPWAAKRGSKKTFEEKLNALGIESVYDLISYFPNRFIDKSQPRRLDDLVDGEEATILGQIKSMSLMSSRKATTIDILNVEDSSTIRTIFWNQDWLPNKFKQGDMVVVTGAVKSFRGRPQITAKTIDFAREVALLPVVPIYRQKLSQKITSPLIMSAVQEAVARIGTQVTYPSSFYGLSKMSLGQDITNLHLPATSSDYDESFERLALFELTNLQLTNLEKKHLTTGQNSSSPVVNKSSELQNRLVDLLPFDLTGSQKKARDIINKKFAKGVSSEILVSADVGAGKTVISQVASAPIVESGYQVAVLAPTEILTQQLYASFSQVFDKLGVVVETSTQKTAKETRELKERVASGDVDILIGTTEVLSYGFYNLGLVVIDEQQKFGVRQRGELSRKSESLGQSPYVLMTTATPIPRTVAQALYSGLDFIELKDKPKGRLPIKTLWVEEGYRDIVNQQFHEIWLDVAREAKQGKQTFVVAPFVRSSDSVDVASVESVYKALSQGALRELNVGYIHGKMKRDKQKQMMESFAQGNIDVLVSSIVVEVGVDIPNATRMVILSADRLGASSLHQTRGRIGRNSYQSVCYLVANEPTEKGARRLQALVDHESGFDIAKIDLGSRGEGQIFGNEQSGRSDLTFANLSEFAYLLPQAKELAELIYSSGKKEQSLKHAGRLLPKTGKEE